MKTVLLIGAIFCITQSSALKPDYSITGQVILQSSHSEFSFIRGHKQGKNHTVTWGMTNNAGISHFIIERTYEDPNDPYSVWQTVGMMPCNHMPIFKFTDNPFLPGTLNYRIRAVMHNQSELVSPLYTIYIQ